MNRDLMDWTESRHELVCGLCSRVIHEGERHLGYVWDFPLDDARHKVCKGCSDLMDGFSLWEKFDNECPTREQFRDGVANLSLVYGVKAMPPAAVHGLVDKLLAVKRGDV